ncbi:MAG: Ldh family oxidoreductase, partial [Candidatus Dormibacteraeota bacterium]|nr:Ldh family oxidoreductase [Candidatus Dormibacteraeota bacterium]
VDPSAFGDAGAYRAAAAGKLEALKAVPAAPGFDEVLVPGEPERRSRERRGGGIPIPAATWGALLGLAERFEVPIPSA